MKRRTLLSTAAAGLAGCTGGGTSGDENAPDEDAPPDERLQQRVNSVLSSSMFAGNYQTDVERDGDGYSVVSVYRVDSNLGADGTENQTKRIAYQAAEAVFVEDSANITAFSIVGITTVVDEMGRESEADLSEVVISGDTADEVVWSNVNYDMIDGFADEYVFHDEYY
jgi:hypothetical protein